MPDLESFDLSATPSHLTDEKLDGEGLPPSYRMRADAHYVDLLTSRRDAKPQAESRIDAVLEQLADDLATLQSAAALISGDGSAVARRVGADLVHSHVWRANWLLRSHQILEGQRRSYPRARPIGRILQQACDGLAAECRLTGCQLSVVVSDWNETVDVDEEALAAGVTGAVLATLGLGGGQEPLSVRVSASRASGEMAVIEVTQTGVRVAPPPNGRFFDASWADRPGGRLSSLGATIASAMAHRLSGEVAFLASERTGSTIRFTFRSIAAR